jgi:hypothetical protein
MSTAIQHAAAFRVQAAIEKLPQIDIRTDHIIHAGIYTRTIRLNRGDVIVGALIKVPTTLIVCGSTRMFTGAGWAELEGYNVLAARAGRKQVFVARTEVWITMSFRTDAKTVEQAEAEFTDEAESLMSRKSEFDTVTVTGDL